MHQARKFFADTYGVTDADLEKYLAAALAAGGEYADLYFEYRATEGDSRIDHDWRFAVRSRRARREQE